MKVLLDHPYPFFLGHGGLQIQIEQTKSALERSGLTVEWVRWWDPDQKGDLIHFFGRPQVAYLEQARLKKIPVVMSDIMSGLGARSASRRRLQRLLIVTARKFLPRDFLLRLGWESFSLVERIFTLTEWEGRLVTEMFDAPSYKVKVVPNGVEKEFFEASALSKKESLVCTATITPLKRVLETARAAVEAKVPIRFVGKPFNEQHPYVQEFREFVGSHPELLTYSGGISDRLEMARVYGEARGFVLLSQMEGQSLAALEAAAAGCPLLLSDLPWARTSFPVGASFCPVTSNVSETAQHLRRFFDAAPLHPRPQKPQTWDDIAAVLKSHYLEVMKEA